MKKTPKELMAAFIAQKEAEKAKSTVVPVDEPKAEAQKTDKKLTSDFLKALAVQDRAALRAMQPAIEAEYKALTDGQNVTNTTDGGLLVPLEISFQIIDKLKYLSPIRQYATVINMANSPKGQLTLGTTKPTAYWVGEGDAITRSKVGFDKRDLQLHKVAALGGLTYEALNDTASIPELQNYVVTQFAEALALKEAEAFVSGDGSKKPYGFTTTDIAAIKGTGKLTHTELAAFQYKLAKPYRDGAIWLGNAATLGKLVGLVDTTGRPLLVTGMAEGEVSTLLTRPVVEEPNIANDKLWYAYMKDYIIGDGGAIRIDFGTTGDDFETDKVSLRVINRVAGRAVMGDGFAEYTIKPSV